MSKTINQALADLVTGLGESSSILADNKTVSDYIADVETAIKDYAGATAEALIDDTASSETKTYSSSKIVSLIPAIDDSEASETKTYSSSKIESLIPEAELPRVTTSDRGKVLAVVPDGNNMKWGKTGGVMILTGSIADGVFTIDNNSPYKKLADVTQCINSGGIAIVRASITENWVTTYVNIVYQGNHNFVGSFRNADSTTYYSFTFSGGWGDEDIITNVSVTSVTVNDPT